jgi:hypothetical protein
MLRLTVTQKKRHLAAPDRTSAGPARWALSPVRDAARPRRRFLTSKLLWLCLALETLAPGGPTSAEVPLGRLGVLPAPLPMPSGTPDLAAAILAEKVAAGGEESLPALVTALQASGFTIRSPRGNVQLRPTGIDQGLSIGTWEVQALARLVAQGPVVSLSGVNKQLTGALRALRGAPLGALIQDALRAHFNSSSSKLRFWARFVVELGREATEPRDLLAVTPDVPLDAVQLALIMRRLAGDILATATAVPMRERSADALAPASPCRFEGSAGTVMDAAAAASTIAFEKVLEYLDKHGVNNAGKWKKRNSWANLALSYTKLYLMFSALRADFKMNKGGPPLRRTKETGKLNGGEDRELTVAFRFDIRKVDWLKCFRIMFNGMGIDVDLPADGAVKGARTQWSLVKGGFSMATGPGIVQFKSDKPFKDPTRQPTDEHGVSRIVIQGAPQPQPVPAGAAQNVEKVAEVRVGIVVKPPNLFQDAVDLGGTAAGGFGGLLTLPVDILERTDWIPRFYEFTVLDWGGTWAGSITIDTPRQTLTETAPGPGFVATLTNTVEHHLQIEIGGGKAYANQVYEGEFRDRYVSPVDCAEFVQDVVTYGEAIKEGVPTLAAVVLNDDGTYEIRFIPPIYQLSDIQGHTVARTMVTRWSCPGTKPPGSEQETGIFGGGVHPSDLLRPMPTLIYSLKGKLDPQNPNVLSCGPSDSSCTSSWTTPDREIAKCYTTNATWHLTR